MDLATMADLNRQQELDNKEYDDDINIPKDYLDKVRCIFIILVVFIASS